MEDPVMILNCFGPRLMFMLNVVADDVPATLSPATLNEIDMDNARRELQLWITVTEMHPDNAIINMCQ